MTNLINISQGLITPLPQPIDDVYSGLIASKHKQTTRNTYKQGLKHFANYLLSGTMSLGKKVDLTESQVKGVLMEYLKFDGKLANAYLGSYQSQMVESGYSPNSINVKIASIKALVRYAFDYEQCNFLLDKVKSLTPEIYRDTKGTNVANIKSMLELPDTTTVKGKRDYAILRLLWDCGLRRGEVSNLNIEDFNGGDHGVALRDRSLKIKGKGKLSKEVIYLSTQCASAIQSWLDVRYQPHSDYPLFISLDNATNGHRLSTKSIYRITKKYSAEVPLGKVLSPHQVRHSAITAVLDASNGNVRLAQKFSRHKNLDVLTRYDDNRVELQKEAVNLLADMV
jgi:integrase/recombinase XerC